MSIVIVVIDPAKTTLSNLFIHFWDPSNVSPLRFFEVNLSEDAIWPVRVHAVIVSPQSHSVPMLISVTYLAKD